MRNDTSSGLKFEPLLFNAMTYPDVKSFTMVLYEQLHEQFFNEPPKRKLKRTDDDEEIAYHIERLLVRISESHKRTGKVLAHKVIVIDEVDCFSHYEKAFTLLVKHILKPTAGATKTSIIGIANSVDLPFRKKHSAIAMRDT